MLSINHSSLNNCKHNHHSNFQPSFWKCRKWSFIEVRGSISLLTSPVLWWGDMTNVQVVKLFFIPRQRGIAVATSPNRSASSSRMMIMKTNGSLAWRWNHMRITGRRKHACACIHTHRPKYTNLQGMRQNKSLLCALACVKGGWGIPARLVCLCICILWCVCDCLLTDDRNLMNLWFQCLRFDASSPAFLCHVISRQAFEPQLKTTGCVVTHHPCRLVSHHHFSCFAIISERFWRWSKVYTNSHRVFRTDTIQCL